MICDRISCRSSIQIELNIMEFISLPVLYHKNIFIKSCKLIMLLLRVYNKWITHLLVLNIHLFKNEMDRNPLNQVKAQYLSQGKISVLYPYSFCTYVRASHCTNELNEWKFISGLLFIPSFFQQKNPVIAQFYLVSFKNVSFGAIHLIITGSITEITFSY